MIAAPAICVDERTHGNVAGGTGLSVSSNEAAPGRRDTTGAGTEERSPGAEWRRSGHLGARGVTGAALKTSGLQGGRSLSNWRWDNTPATGKRSQRAHMAHTRTADGFTP